MNQLYNLVKYFPDNIDISILTLSPEPSSSLMTDFEQLGIDIHQLGIHRLRTFFFAKKKVQSIINDRQPDVIHSHGFRADMIISNLSTSSTTVSTIHTDFLTQYQNEYGKLLGFALAKYHLKRHYHIDCSIACSRYIKNQIPSESIDPHVILNGVDRDRFSPPNDTQRDTIKQNLNIQSSETVFIYLGSLSSGKNPELVIRGFARSDVNQARLLIVGDGKQFEACQDLSESISGVELVGHTQNPSRYLKAADYFISASQFEGLPMAVLEALATGLPVCLSNIPPHKEILGYNPNAGITFDHEDEIFLAKAIESISAESWENKSQSAREIISDHLNSKNMSKQYLDLYTDLEYEKE